MAVGRIGLVTGLQFEADILTAQAKAAGISDLLDIRASGPGQARACETGRSMIAQGAGLLISMGLAGGLDARLKPGDVVLANSVIGPDGKKLLTADSQRRSLMCRLQDREPDRAQPWSFYEGALASSLDPVVTLAAKADLHRASGALAVDMESYGTGCAAREAEVPFLVLRVVSDTHNQSVPGPALMGMNADGTVSPWPVIKGILKSPGALPGLLVLGHQSITAKKSLARLGEGLFRSLF